MPEYRVTWEIDVEASTPVEAAREARRMQVDPETTATVFRVSDFEIDITDVDAAPDRHCPVCGGEHTKNEKE